MCLIAIAQNLSADLPLIVAANRDEFHERPTQGLHWWQQSPPVLAGRDLSAGGTWLGLNRRGDWGALLNRRPAAAQMAAPATSLRSRGELIPLWLASDLSPEDFARQHLKEISAYQPFSLIVGKLGEPAALLASPEQRVELIADGVHAFSNCPPDADWPKTRQLKGDLQHLAGRHASEDPAAFCRHIVSMLGREATSFTDAASADLQSARFILSPHYGTRCSSAVVASAAGAGEIAVLESQWDAAGQAIPAGESFYRFAPEA